MPIRKEGLRLAVSNVVLREVLLDTDRSAFTALTISNTPVTREETRIGFTAKTI